MQQSNALTTRCIGRYLIDLPSDLVLNPSGGQTIDGVTLRVTPATVEEYKKALARRTAELTTTVISYDGAAYPALRKTVPLPAGTDGVLFDRAELEGGISRVTRVMEVLAWRDGYLLKAEVTGNDTTFPEEKDNVTLHTCVFHAKLDTHSTANWTPSPAQTGHSFHVKLDTQSSANWTPVPLQTGQFEAA
jgi:hypothetical protein